MTAPTRERQTTDALIARGLAHAQAAGPCPKPDVLGAFHDRTLDADEADRWLAHVADCQRCQAVLAAVGRAEADVGADTRGSTMSARWRWRILAPLSALSIVVLAVWVADPVLNPVDPVVGLGVDRASTLDRQVISEAPQTLPQTQRAATTTASSSPPARLGHTERPAFDQAAWAAGFLTAAHGSDAGAGGRLRRQRRCPSPARRGFTLADMPSTRQRGLLVISQRHAALMLVPADDCDVNGGVLLLRSAATHRPAGV